MIAIPDAFRETIPRIFGEGGCVWLAELPEIVARCRERWELASVMPVADLSVNYVAFAVTEVGEAAVLKIGVPHRELFTEMTALQCYGGQRMVPCLDADRALGAMLLERLTPGQMLTALGDNAAETRVAADIMRALPLPCPTEQELPTFAEWLKTAFARLRVERGPGCGPLGRRLVEQADVAFADIQSSSQGDVLLHGDLHHENILFDERRGWTAIDPKGVIGDATLEVGRFLHNQLPCTLPLGEKQRRIEERADILAAELGASRERILACALIDKVLSLSWALEDSHVTADWPGGVEVAELLAKMADG